MSDDKRRRLSEELTEGFILREQQLTSPSLTLPNPSEARTRYMNDPYFRGRVDSAVCGVMQVVEKYL